MLCLLNSHETIQRSTTLDVSLLMIPNVEKSDYNSVPYMYVYVCALLWVICSIDDDERDKVWVVNPTHTAGSCARQHISWSEPLVDHKREGGGDLENMTHRMLWGERLPLCWDVSEDPWWLNQIWCENVLFSGILKSKVTSHLWLVINRILIFLFLLQICIK